MAPPTDLLQVAREGFPMIDEFYGRQQWTPPSHRQNNPCVYRYTESPLITERPPYAQVLPNGTIIHYTQHQYTYQPSPTIRSMHEVSQYKGSGGRSQ
ncbi:hypothetical protein CDL15_Pgr011329 [Punica granatum]|uniref:Uncharacterized protein n=1 Tax=Punica granatum TaxID=22663 RepID=A0A218WGQ4_PUNGR|nr:hypothetical protein CDL15_Pgr011329 [Punica granatum]PKI65049.1 hypothetical protein CRG98_014518 [Punica granatum]